MGIGTRSRAVRAGLVALLLFRLAVPSFSQDQRQGSGKEAEGKPATLTLKSLEEVKKSGCRRLYRSPLYLLYFLPGPLFFLLALAAKNKKKPFLFFLLFLLLGSSDPLPSSLIREAELDFSTGSYSSALRLLRQADRLMACNPSLQYNLGIVSHYLDERGYAVHYLRRSLKERPEDVEARRALRALEETYGLEGQVSPPLPVRPDLAYLLLVVLANATFVMAAFVVRRKGVRFLISFVLLAIAALGSLAFFVAVLHSDSRSAGVVIRKTATVLRVPEQDGKPWFELPAGTSLWIRGETGQFYLVETASKLKGWMASDAVLLD